MLFSTTLTFKTAQHNRVKKLSIIKADFLISKDVKLIKKESSGANVKPCKID